MNSTVYYLFRERFATPRHKLYSLGGVKNLGVLRILLGLSLIWAVACRSVQRPDGGRWAGIWEFPHHELEWMESHDAGAQRLLDRLGLQGRAAEDIGTIRHTVTRFNITMTCLLIHHQRGDPKTTEYNDAAWVRADELTSYPLSAPQRRIARRLLEKNG